MFLDSILFKSAGISIYYTDCSQGQYSNIILTLKVLKVLKSLDFVAVVYWEDLDGSDIAKEKQFPNTIDPHVVIIHRKYKVTLND